MTALVGILVGGRGTRMGGTPKGLLPAPGSGEPLAARLARIAREAVPGAVVVLVGGDGAHAALGLPFLPDDPPGVGPLGGIAALLGAAAEQGRTAMCLATDLPHVTTELVARLAAHSPGAAAVAPRQEGVWQPLFARYDPAACLSPARAALASGRLAARGILEALGDAAVPLPLSIEEAPLLDDWDTPEDVARSTGRRG